MPGNIFARGSQGTNRLIRDGAMPVLSANDVLEALNLTTVAQQVEAHMLFPTDATEAQLFEQLADEPLHVDEISRAVGMPIATVTSSLALMELKGLVRQVGGMSYIRRASRDRCTLSTEWRQDVQCCMLSLWPGAPARDCGP